MKAGYLLAIDQGTTSTRAILFRTDGSIAGLAQQEFTQHFPYERWVEHDVEEIWSATKAVAAGALAKAGATAADVAGLGITNQRETSVLWDRQTGEPIHRAIVLQDRRTAEHCAWLTADGQAEFVRSTTGLIIDPYFSATKIAWMLDNVPGARARAARGELAFGTMDSFLLWRLTGGRVHATDATNAARTMLFDIHAQTWHDGLLELFNIPRSLLPEVKDSSAVYGATEAGLFGAAIPIGGVAGDQHAATFGQACVEPGMVKCTFGTGAFAVLNTGRTPIESKNRLLTTLAYRLDGKPTYALEGSVFVAGAAIKWLRDRLGIIKDAGEAESLARNLSDTGGAYLVPAFVGLGAPHWDPGARGALVGLTLDTGVPQIARAALESVCYQTADLIQAMNDDIAGIGGKPVSSLRVDGGMVVNDWLMQFLADMLDVPVERPQVAETTALGAAYLAGLAVGVYGSVAEISRQWQRQACFSPNVDASVRRHRLAGWHDAVARVRS